MEFNADDHSTQDFAPLSGPYRVEVEDAVRGPTKNGRGEVLTLKLRILGPRDGGRVVYARFTLEHRDSPRAKEIGLGQLSAASRALGMPKWKHEGQLIGQRAEVVLEPDGEWTKVRRWVVPGAEASNPYRDAARREDPPKPAPRGNVPPPNDDDIPF